MRSHVFASLAMLLLLSGTALAQQDPSIEAAPAEPATQAPTLAAPATAAPPVMAPAATAPAVTADATSAPAAESTDDNKKFVLGLRTLGVAFPMGNTASGSKLGDLTSALIPLWLEVGYMVTPNVMLGAYAQYAIAGGGANWVGSGSDIRLGVQGQYHPNARGTVDPWVGLGIGYEILKMNADLLGYTASMTLKGPEFANLQACVDFNVWSTLRIGPFASFSIDEYTTGSASMPGAGSQSGSIDNKSLHEWFMIGGHASLRL